MIRRLKEIWGTVWEAFSWPLFPKETEEHWSKGLQEYIEKATALEPPNDPLEQVEEVIQLLMRARWYLQYNPPIQQHRPPLYGPGAHLGDWIIGSLKAAEEERRRLIQERTEIQEQEGYSL